MKKICLFLVILLCFLFAGCDKNKNEDIRISEYGAYINNTEHYDISTFNGYKCIDIDETKNADGSYTVTFQFKKIESTE